MRTFPHDEVLNNIVREQFCPFRHARFSRLSQLDHNINAADTFVKKLNGGDDINRNIGPILAANV